VLLGILSFLIIPLFIILWKYLEVRKTTYELTPERLRLTQGVLNRRIDDLELYRIKDYRIYQPFIYRLFKVSNIILETSDKSHPTFILRAVHKGEELLDMIRVRVEELRAVKRVSEIDV
jgi:uncharacterized membrane protein YdbT with pleckstrin-like domain